MDKVAQKRRWYNKLREKLNQPEESLIGKFSPEFVELMDKLREVDDNIREQATELKGVLKLAKSNFNRLEYMTSIAYLGRFHEKMEAINYEFSKLGTAVDLKHHEFLFGDMDQEDVDYLVKKLSPKIKKPVAKPLSIKNLSKNINTKASLETTAGIQDWWAQNFGERRKALSAWEKRFPKKSKELKRQTQSLIVKSEQILGLLLTTLSALNTYRNTRRLEEYLATADKFKQKYAIYNALFGQFYNTYIREFVELQQQKMEEHPVDLSLFEEEPKAGPTPITEKTAPPTHEQAPIAEVAPAVPVAPMAQPQDFLVQPKARSWPQPVEPGAPADTQYKIPEHLKQWMAEEKAKNKQADEGGMSPITEHDVGSTLRSPHPAPISTEHTLSEPVFELSRMPNESETTLVSPQLPIQHRDRPIDVSVAEPPAPVPPTPNTRRSASHEEFLEKLTKLAEGDSFKVALEMISYAKSIESKDVEASQKLMQLSKSILSK